MTEEKIKKIKALEFRLACVINDFPHMRYITFDYNKETLYIL